MRASSRGFGEMGGGLQSCGTQRGVTAATALNQKHCPIWITLACVLPTVEWTLPGCSDTPSAELQHSQNWQEINRLFARSATGTGPTQRDGTSKWGVQMAGGIFCVKTSTMLIWINFIHWTLFNNPKNPRINQHKKSRLETRETTVPQHTNNGAFRSVRVSFESEKGVWIKDWLGKGVPERGCCAWERLVTVGGWIERLRRGSGN